MKSNMNIEQLGKVNERIKIYTTDEELLKYLLNIYQTMMLRGMLGTYIYVCDPGLKKYLKKYRLYIVRILERFGLKK